MARRIVAMVPQIGNLMIGEQYDIVLNEESVHDSTITDLPVDDPNKSFINDMNRDLPVQYSLSIVVSTIGVNGSNHVSDTTRMSRLYESLLELKRMQVSDPESLLDVHTGIITLRNMAISQIRPFRRKEQSQSQVFDLSLKELRFAKSPVRIEAVVQNIASSQGALSANNERVVTEADRPITEQTNDSAVRQTQSTNDSDESILFNFFN